jgi:dihydroorotase
MTCEVTPHHLFLSRSDLNSLGTHGRMNPPPRRERRPQKLYDRVADGTVDMIATDHAPHTLTEKDTDIWSAPSGVPGVETALPLLLAEAAADRLDFERVRDLTATNPAAVFDLPDRGLVTAGNYADLVLVDSDTTESVRAENLHTNCEWTPFEGREAIFPEWTMLRGEMVYDGEEDSFGDARGENVRTQGED